MFNLTTMLLRLVSEAKGIDEIEEKAGGRFDFHR
jgi:hypothetical protein